MGVYLVTMATPDVDHLTTASLVRAPISGEMAGLTCVNLIPPQRTGMTTSVHLALRVRQESIVKGICSFVTLKICIPYTYVYNAHFFCSCVEVVARYSCGQ